MEKWIEHRKVHLGREDMEKIRRKDIIFHPPTPEPTNWRSRRLHQSSFRKLFSPMGGINCEIEALLYYKTTFAGFAVSA